MLTSLVDHVLHQSTRRQTKHLRIKLCTLNIQSGWDGQLENALRSMQLMCVDVGVLTETKITDDRHTKLQFGYHVVATQAPSAHQGGVALFWRYDASSWHIEDPTSTTPNTISALLVSGSKRWHLIGTYCSPSLPHDTVCTEITFAAQWHPNTPIILMGDLNANLHSPTTTRDVDFSTLTLSLHLIDPLGLFKQRNDRSYTWKQKLHDGRIITSCCDYILTPAGHRIFNAQIVPPECFCSDHYAVWTFIAGQETQTHQRIVCFRSHFPSFLSATIDDWIEDCKFQILKDHWDPPSRPSAPDARQRSWISQRTWNLIDARHTLRRFSARATILMSLRHQIRRSLNCDRRDRFEKIGADIDAHLRDKSYIPAWHLIRPFYRR